MKMHSRLIAAAMFVAFGATASAATPPTATPSSSQSTFMTFKLTAAPAATLPAENYVAVQNVLAGAMQKTKRFEPVGEKQPLQAKSPAAQTDVITAYGYGAGIAIMLKAKEAIGVKVQKAGQFQPGGKYVEGALTAVAIWGASTNSVMIGAS